MVRVMSLLLREYENSQSLGWNRMLATRFDPLCEIINHPNHWY
jgi:hypothetical protein